MIAPCSSAQAAEILAIFNEAIVSSTALYDYQPRTMETMQAWFATKEAGNFPVLGSFAADGSLTGFATLGAFRPFAGYKYTAEHSVYVRGDQRGQGLGRQLLTALIEAARQRDIHVLVGVVDAENAASIHLHRQAGFSHAGTIRQAGYKFGAWRDVAFYQLVLDTPAEPQEI